MAECKICKGYTTYFNGYCTACYKTIIANQTFEKENAPTEGEEYLEDFFKFYGIKFRPQITIKDLSNDGAEYRVADFYLPQYDVYVEFLGQWGIAEGKKRYLEKMAVYKSNNIPCVYLYPENLGFIDFSFDKRLQIVLKKHNKFKELSKYKRFKLWKGESERLLFIGFIVAVMCVVDYKNNPGNNIAWVLGATAGLCFQFYKILTTYNKIYKLNRYPLSNLK